MNPLVYIIILNWKSAQETIECVQSVEKSDYTNYKIIIIDNASPDNSEKILRERFPQHHFIQTGKNLGYAGGNNAGILEALKDETDFIWILNPDVCAGINSLSELIELMQGHPQTGICGPLIQEGIPPLIKTYGPRYLDPAQGYLGQRPEFDQKILKESAKFIETDFVTGCSIFIRAQVFFDVGLLREDFFMLYEETEFCFRARRKGWKSEICLQGTDFHFWAKEKKSDLGYYSIRNVIIFARIQKKYIFKTVILRLRLNYIVCLFLSLRFREALYILKRRLIPVIIGLFMPLKPILVVKSPL